MSDHRVSRAEVLEAAQWLALEGVSCVSATKVINHLGRGSQHTVGLHLSQLRRAGLLSRSRELREWNDGRFIVPKGLLQVTCWCEAALVAVTPADVRAGRTLSCGLAGCTPALLEAAS